MANEDIEGLKSKIDLALEEAGNNVVEVRRRSREEAEKIRTYYQDKCDVRVWPCFSDDDFSGGRVEYVVHISERG